MRSSGEDDQGYQTAVAELIVEVGRQRYLKCISAHKSQKWRPIVPGARTLGPNNEQQYLESNVDGLLNRMDEAVDDLCGSSDSPRLLAVG